MSGIDKDTQLLEFYRTADESRRFEGNLVWIRFSGMLVANSILIPISVGALALEGGREIIVVAGWLVSMAGLLLCGAWWWLTARAMQMFTAWKDIMYELEDQIYTDEEVSKQLAMFRGTVRSKHLRLHYVQHGVTATFAMLHLALGITLYVVLVNSLAT